MTDEREKRRQAEHDRLIAELLDPHEPHTVADQAYASEMRSMQRELDRLRQQLAERGEPEPYAYEYYWPESSKHGRKLAYPNGLPTTGLDDLITVPLYRKAPPAQSAVPEGWKLVPVEPTEEMIDAGHREKDKLAKTMDEPPCNSDAALATVYGAMLDAAPSAGEAQGDGREAWRPVSEAPKDGTQILVRGPSGYLPPHDTTYISAHWNIVKGRWEDDHGDALSDFGFTPVEWLDLAAIAAQRGGE